MEVTGVIQSEPAIAHYCLFKSNWENAKAVSFYFDKSAEARREVADGWEAKQQKSLDKPKSEDTKPKQTEAPVAPKIVVSDNAKTLSEIIVKNAVLCEAVLQKCNNQMDNATNYFFSHTESDLIQLEVEFRKNYKPPSQETKENDKIKPSSNHLEQKTDSPPNIEEEEVKGDTETLETLKKNYLNRPNVVTDLALALGCCSGSTGVVWDSNFGSMRWRSAQDGDAPRQWFGAIVEGEFSSNKAVTAITRVEGGRWALSGYHYRRTDQSSATSFKIECDDAAQTISGRWYREQVNGELSAKRVTDATRLKLLRSAEKSANHAGLTNMEPGLVNVCYQNSVLQTLFMTRPFCENLISLENFFGLLDADNNTESITPVTSAVQNLFTELQFSQKAVHNTARLQNCLPEFYRSGKQQDTGEFRTFLMEKLSSEALMLASSPAPPSRTEASSQLRRLESLRTPREAVANANGRMLSPEFFFGGKIAHVDQCPVCQNTDYREEMNLELPLTFPRRYSPVSHLSVLVVPRAEAKPGSVIIQKKYLTIPDGFEKINVDLNDGRRGDEIPRIFLLAKRDASTNFLLSDVMIKTFNRCNRVNNVATGVTYVENFSDAQIMTSAKHWASNNGYQMIDQDLNAGGSTSAQSVFLLYKRDNINSAITDLKIAEAGDPTPPGSKRINKDLSSGGGGKTLHLCYSKDLPVTHVRLSQGGMRGYEFLDVDLRMKKSEAHQKLNLTYRMQKGDRGTDLPLTSLVVMDDAERTAALGEGKLEDCGPALRESKTANGSNTHLWLMQHRGHGCPIYDLQVFRAPFRLSKFSEYESIVIEGPDPDRPKATTHPEIETSCLYMNADKSKRDSENMHLRFFKKLTHVGYRVFGKYDKDGGGTLDCITTKHGKLWLIFGLYKQPEGKEQILEFILTNDDLKITLGKNTIPQAADKVKRATTEFTRTAAITNVVITVEPEPTPPGFVRLEPALNYGTGAPKTVHLCVEKGGDGVPIVDVGVLMVGVGEAASEDCVPIVHSYGGQDADLNAGATVEVVLYCYMCASVVCMRVETATSLCYVY